ncbi:MAG: tyrosine-type recombinase/integrase [Candidatus Gastranaerophilales bacterium]|nr:tyrosine-type recombinase/integrase [Candidatus Gastranaerophilales bacterium]
MPLKFKEASEKYIKGLKETGGKSITKKEQQLRMYLVPFFKNYIVSKISTFDIEKYKSERSKTDISKSTINREIQTLSHMLNSLEDWGLIPHKNCKIKKFREDNARNFALSPEECNRILDIASRYSNQYIYPFILIALGTSMRRSEILSSELKNINIAERVIYIPHAKAGARTQMMTKEVANFLRDYIPMVDSSQPYLFPSKNAKSGHLKWIDKAFRAVVEEAGLDSKVVVRHTLRHTAITRLAEAGVDLRTIQRISGHKTIQMVIRYSHQSGAHVKQAMDVLENSYKTGCESNLKAI